MDAHSKVKYRNGCKEVMLGVQYSGIDSFGGICLEQWNGTENENRLNIPKQSLSRLAIFGRSSYSTDNLVISDYYFNYRIKFRKIKWSSIANKKGNLNSFLLFQNISCQKNIPKTNKKYNGIYKILKW